MADDKKASQAESKLAEVLPPFETVQLDPEEAERIIPKKGSDGYETPSGYALAKVGEFKGEPGSEEARIHGLQYLYEKVKKRWGFGG
jgi:hypothetical protein